MTKLPSLATVLVCLVAGLVGAALWGFGQAVYGDHQRLEALWQVAVQQAQMQQAAQQHAQAQAPVPQK